MIQDKALACEKPVNVTEILPEGKIRVVLLIHRLDRGGAERQLITLANGLDKSIFKVWVVTFYDGGSMECCLSGDKGVVKKGLGRSSRWGAIGCFGRLINYLRHVKPHVVYGFMEVPSVMALMGGRVVGARVIWGLRRSERKLLDYDWSERLSFHVGKWLSSMADLIIVNSERGKDDYTSLGYCKDRMVVIPNGIDTRMFYRDKIKGEALRRSWSLPDGTRVVGVVGRLHPMKGHEVFLEAAAEVSRRFSSVHFVCAGKGQKWFEEHLLKKSKELGVEGRIMWVGEVDDMVALYSALDILCLPSVYGEGFPNVVGEAMSCEVPCVVTRVGDSEEIVGTSGLVVVPGDVSELVVSLSQMLTKSREELDKLGIQARKRIVERFDVSLMVDRTSLFLTKLCRQGTYTG